MGEPRRLTTLWASTALITGIALPLQRNCNEVLETEISKHASICITETIIDLLMNYLRLRLYNYSK
jgi:hypothetical protein